MKLFFLLALLLFPTALCAQIVVETDPVDVVIDGKTDLPVIEPAKDQKEILYTVDISTWPKAAVVIMEIFGDGAKTPFCRATFVKQVAGEATLKCPLFGDPSSTTRQALPVATVIQGGILDATVKGETK